MKTREALTVLAAHRGDAIVVCALGMAANEWWAVTKSEDSFYMHGGMGFDLDYPDVDRAQTFLADLAEFDVFILGDIAPGSISD